jgi:hypothetical protein
MRYSEDWLAKISSTPFYEKRMSWDDIYKHYHFDNPRVRDEQKVVIFPEGVWMEISRCFSSQYDFIKIKAVSSDDIFFDGSDRDGTIAMGSLVHIFKIDGHSIDLAKQPESKDRQGELLKFVYTYSHISDPRLPPVPKGILKI